MDINGQLRRNLKPGYEYEGLIPKYKGIQHDFEKTPTSDTYDTLKFMALWVEKYHHQMSRIAPKLKGATLEKTVKNIYEFLYWHFQYKLDESLQQLYSPSAAWHFRKTGFDCKTFSLLASCILTEMGNIPHSFRKVQQPGIMPGEWSHVYVIVHDKQKYHVIDATTHSNTEVYFSKKYDFMLKHRGLAGSYSAAMPGKPAFNGLGNNKMATFNGLGCGPNTNCGCGSLNGLGSSSVSWNDIKNLFTGIDCIGGSAYTDGLLNRNIQNINDLFSEITGKINLANYDRNLNQLAIEVARFHATAKLLLETYTKKKASKSWNSCTNKNFDATILAIKFYITSSTALQGWLQTYFNIGSVKNTMTVTNEGWETSEKFWGMALTPWLTISQPVYNLTEKQTAPNFEINQYLLQSHKANSFNLSAFLQTLSSVANVVGGGPNNNSGSNTGVINPDGSITPTYTNTSSGISPTAMGVGAVGIIAGILFWPSIKKAIFSNSNSK